MFVPLSTPDITPLEKKYVLEVLDSGQLSFGESLHQFEDIFCRRFDTSYAVAMNSGTSALHVAVKSLGLTKGDEVITTPYSFIASSNCLIYEGVTPIFVDIDPDTLNMDTSQIEKVITPKTKAILAVHIFGQPCPMDEIQRIAQKHDLYVIEDACEALGAKWKGRWAGTLGNVSTFAFYPNKQITTGEGGMLLTDDEQIYKTACSLRNQGRNMDKKWLEHERIGYNYRMSDLQAAVGVAQMERLPEILQKREDVASRYQQLIKQYQLPLSIPTISPHAVISWFVFIVKLPADVNRSQLMTRLFSKGIQSKPYFPSIHLQKSYQSLFHYQGGDFPISEEMSRCTLAIPFFSNLTFAEQKYVIEQLYNELERQK